MIVCGWCHADTPRERCVSCGHDPAVPWVQRALEPPIVTPALQNGRRLADAAAELRRMGSEPTAERIAELLGIDARTVRRWKSADVRPKT